MLHAQSHYDLPEHWMLSQLPPSVWGVDHDYYVSRVVNLVAESGAKTVLEVGCGDGWNCAALVERGLTVYGVDSSPNAVSFARHFVRDATFFVGDLTDPEFAAALPPRFDAVLMVEVIEHIPPSKAVEVLRKVRTLVSPGGILVVTTPSVNVPNDNPQHYRHFSPEILVRELSEAGFTAERVEGYGNVEHSRRFWRKMRWVDNRFYSIHSLRHRLWRWYRERLRHGSAELGHGLIVLAR